MTTPAEEAADAGATRDQLEQAAVALFLAAYLSKEEANQPPLESEVALLRNLTSRTARWFLRSLSRAGLGNLEGIRDDEIVDDVLDGLLTQLRSIKQWAATQRDANLGDLSVQRNAARGLATTMFNLVGQRVTEKVQSASESVRTPVVNKIWVTRADSRVRPLHRRLHGDVRRLDGDFYRWPATGQRLRFPGDPLAPLDAVIGCRCVLVMTTSPASEVKEAFPDLPPDE